MAGDLSSGFSALQLSGLIGATGVAAGAFGAHYLKPVLEKRGTVEAFKTGVQYQLLHAVAILAAHKLGSTESTSKWWAVGVLLFSGSIYGLSLGGPRVLGPVTPIGGICMIVGWAKLIWQ